MEGGGFDRSRRFSVGGYPIFVECILISRRGYSSSGVGGNIFTVQGVHFDLEEGGLIHPECRGSYFAEQSRSVIYF